MGNSGKANSSGHGKGMNNVPEGPGVGKQTTQAKEGQYEVASLKQDSPTARSDPGTGKSEHYNSDEKYDKMASWLEETPREDLRKPREKSHGAPSAALREVTGEMSSLLRQRTRQTLS